MTTDRKEETNRTQEAVREETSGAEERSEERQPEKKAPAGRGKRRRRRKLSGSMGAKTAAFFLYMASVITALAGLILIAYMLDYSYFTSYKKDAMAEALYTRARLEMAFLGSYFEDGDLEGAEEYFQDRNVAADLWWYDKDNGENRLLWSSETIDETNCAKITKQIEFTSFTRYITLNNHTLRARQSYIVNIYIDLDFPKEDDLKQVGEALLFLYESRYRVIGLTAVGFLLGFLCFVFLMCAAGHRNDRDGIADGVLTRIPLDVLTVMSGAALGFVLYVMSDIAYSGNFPVVVMAGGTLLALLTLIYLMDIAIRFKKGNMLRYTLVYIVLRGMGRCARWVMAGLPTVLTTAVFFWGVCVLEFIGTAYFTRRSGWIAPWIVEKTLLFLAVMYVAVMCKKLLKAGRAFAEGQESYRVDTSKMFGDFKEHGENLNSVGEGIGRAVAERMKSEHLKTELITNVSHDIKTPLTSIINYSNLICEEKSENERINEYAEVLLRQSGRLRKLLEDLMEVSKAATGNIEVNLQPCEAGVLLTQAVGEYQQKLEEKGLELIARQPETPVRITADGRHLWRVFDNLLNNICKYAQENSRVYLSVETNEGKVSIIFRNMSKYPLEVKPEELEERFVRGDKSRHMEGNGLGLSIAKSLVELQGGRMEIVTDGDLFKVTLVFGLL